jgi:uncharacterized protein YbjT (DUF2867 family)
MILVVGATGQLGGIITRRLLEQGREVRILVRSNATYQPLIDAGAQPVFGDLKDRASLDAACAGAEAVITTANSALRGGEDNAQTVERDGNRNLVDAAKSAGVGQFIFISANGADPASPVPFIQGKGQAEEHLRASGLTYTILAPTAFMEIWPGFVVGGPLAAGQPVTLVGEGRRRHSFISVEDVAAFAVATLGHPDALNQRLVIGGPEPLSWRDVVATYERVLGQEVPVRWVAPGDPVPLPGEMPAILTGFEFYDSVIDMDELARTYGVKLSSLEDVVRRSQGVNSKERIA